MMLKWMIFVCRVSDLINCGDCGGFSVVEVEANLEGCVVEPVTLVITALIAGAAAGVTGATSSAVMDTYQGLKGLVLGRLRSGGVADPDTLVGQAVDQAGRDVLTSELEQTGVDEPMVQAAQDLLELLKDKGKFVVDASQAKGIIVGDHSVQHNTFN